MAGPPWLTRFDRASWPALAPAVVACCCHALVSRQWAVLDLPVRGRRCCPFFARPLLASGCFQSSLSQPSLQLLPPSPVSPTVSCCGSRWSRPVGGFRTLLAFRCVGWCSCRWGGDLADFAAFSASLDRISLWREGSRGVVWVTLFLVESPIAMGRPRAVAGIPPVAVGIPPLVVGRTGEWCGGRSAAIVVGPNAQP